MKTGGRLDTRDEAQAVRAFEETPPEAKGAPATQEWRDFAAAQNKKCRGCWAVRLSGNNNPGLDPS